MYHFFPWLTIEKKMKVTSRVRSVIAAFMAFSPVSCAMLLADIVEVSDTGRMFVSSGSAFKTVTTSVEEFPLTVEPVYWLDASDTASWEFTDDGEILKIPSKSDSSRYLTSRSDEIVYTNYSNNLWWNAVTASKLRKPKLAPADNGLTGPYVDFDLSSSWKTLYFDPVTNGGVCAPSNTISGIGTIVGVYRSYNGGGNILGGSQFRRFTNYHGLRGTNFSEAVVAGGNNNDFITGGMFWSGLQKSAPSSTFWTGGWQVIALNPLSADIVAHGLCGNCEHHDEIYSSGDQGIAELMLFDRILSDSDITNLIVHLEKKWLGVSTVGYNGNASIPWLEIGGANPPHGSHAANYPQDGVDVPITVSSGDTLTVNRLTGGRSTIDRKHRIVKEGSGTLRLNEATSFGGTVNVREGTLSVGVRPTPALSDLAPGLCLRFDPSEGDSVTLEGNLVSAMENLGDSGKYSVRAIQSNASLRPSLVANAPASGLNLVDFNTGDAAGGKCLRFETASAPQIGTLVLVVDSSTYTGAHFMNGMFPMRTTESVRYYVYDQWNLSKALFFTPNEVYVNSKHANMSPLVYGCAWVNGRRVAHETESYDVPGLNVVALRVPATGVTMLGGYSESICGGMRIGEVLGWKGELSDEQIRDAQAYLMNKWLLRPAPGYAAQTATGVAELQEVVAEGNSRIHVPDGKTATIAHLAASGTVYKTGSGTLRLQRSTDTETHLVVADGRVERAAPADVSGVSEIAVAPTLHLDPSQSWSVRTKTYNGTNFVWTLMDSCGLVCATESMQDWNLAKRPFVGAEADDFCNGLQTVNFGPMVCGYNANIGAYLKLSRNITNVRSVYLVLGSQEGGGNPLGCHSTAVTLGDSQLGGRRLDFHRGWSSDDSLKTKPLFDKACASVKNGILYIDGVLQENAVEYIPNGGYELVELHLPAGAQFNALGNGFESYVHGGFRMGEMIVYERELTERERVATRNYLLKKWFAKSDTDLSALPEHSAQSPIGYCLQNLTVDFSGGSKDCQDVRIGFSHGIVVELKNMENLMFGTMIPVMSAADFVETKNLETAVFTGEIIPPNAKVKFKVVDGVLYARYVENLGLRVILR